MIASFLISVGVMCALTTVLAIVMVIADATIANYGEVKLTINGEKEYVVEGGRPLLGTLKEQEVFIPSACGGRGSCGLCKLKVTGGAGDHLPTELPWLSKEEMADKVRLSCQVKVKSDMQIQIPEELFKVKQYSAEVVSLRDLTYDIKEVRMRLLEPDAIETRAGEFVQIEVPAYDLTDEPVYRAYSMSTPPSSRNEVELEVRYVPNGICTTYVHQHLKEGDKITLNGPYGDFYLHDTDREMICIAGGSGMAPIKAILNHMVDEGTNRKCRYFFGARAVRDLFLVDAMEDLEKKLPDFAFIPALSDPQDEDDWKGETGLITEVVGRHIEDAAEAEAYLCGSPFMIDACLEVLLKKGMPRERIYYDKFA